MSDSFGCMLAEQIKAHGRRVKGKSGHERDNDSYEQVIVQQQSPTNDPDTLVV